MILRAPEATTEATTEAMTEADEGIGYDYRCCVCGEVLPYHPAFCVEHDCPHCGASLWCFQRNQIQPIGLDASIVLEALPGRTPALEDIDRLTRALLASHHELHVTIELSALEIVNSALVAMLVLLNKRLRAAGGSLRLCGLTPVVREIFSRFKLNTLFEIVDEACV